MKFFSAAQYEFFKGKSTVNTDFLLDKIDKRSRNKKNKFNLLMPFDISGAFDNVS